MKQSQASGDLSWPESTTKNDAMKILEEKLKTELPGYQTFDYVLPQQWVDDVREKTGEDVGPHFVWIYEQRSVFGRPFPITNEGKQILTTYNEIAETSYPV